jgi:hypothetical protein
MLSEIPLVLVFEPEKFEFKSLFIHFLSERVGTARFYAYSAHKSKIVRFEQISKLAKEKGKKDYCQKSKHVSGGILKISTWRRERICLYIL